MGSSPSLAQAQCPVEPVKQAQIPIGCKCGNTKVKWRCENCVSMLCDMCKDKDHADKGHHIIDITTIQVKISDEKEYQTTVRYYTNLAVSYDNSLWIGDGDKEEGFHPFTSPTALQNVKLVGDKVKVISSFNIYVFCVAVTPSHDILLATLQPRLKQIKAGSNKVTDSIYFVESNDLCILHVTKDGRVIVSNMNVIVVIDAAGIHLTRYEKDEDNEPVFCFSSITSTMNGNIFVSGDRKVLVFEEREIINIFKGHSTVNDDVTEFSPLSLVTTPMDNVIVADMDSHTLHILNNTGHLLTTYNTLDIELYFPEQLAISTEGSFNVLYMHCLNSSTSIFKMVIAGC